MATKTAAPAKRRMWLIATKTQSGWGIFIGTRLEMKSLCAELQKGDDKVDEIIRAKIYIHYRRKNKEEIKPN